MTDRIENLISDLLASKATEATDGGVGLTGEARQRGRRLVVRRRITAGVACVAALAAGVPSGAWLFGMGGNREVGPAGSIFGQAVRPKIPSTLSKITIDDLSKLPQGASPAVPYFAKGRLYDGERELGLTRLSDDAMFAPVYGGYLVQVTNNDADVPDKDLNQVILVDAAGNKVRDLPTINLHAPRALPAVSADGRAFAWPEWTASGSGSKLVIGDSATGEVLHSKVIDDVPFPYPVGFVGEKVVFAAGALDPSCCSPDDSSEHEEAVEKYNTEVGAGATGIWDPATGAVSQIDKAGTARGSDDFEHILTGVNAAQNCLAGYSATDTKRLWKTCGIEFSELSRAGLVIGEVNIHNEKKQRTVVLDVATGRRLLEIKGAVENFVWERGDDLLLIAHDRKGTAIVRCSLAGRCERATGYLPEWPGGPPRLPDLP